MPLPLCLLVFLLVEGEGNNVPCSEETGSLIETSMISGLDWHTKSLILISNKIGSGT